MTGLKLPVENVKEFASNYFQKGKCGPSCIDKSMFGWSKQLMDWSEWTYLDGDFTNDRKIRFNEDSGLLITASGVCLDSKLPAVEWKKSMPAASSAKSNQAVSVPAVSSAKSKPSKIKPITSFFRPTRVDATTAPPIPLLNKEGDSDVEIIEIDSDDEVSFLDMADQLHHKRARKTDYKSNCDDKGNLFRTDRSVAPSPSLDKDESEFELDQSKSEDDLSNN